VVVNGTAGNGAPPDPQALGLSFDYARWRKLTELAVAEGEKRLADTHQAIRDAQAAVLLREQELDVLRRALALAPRAAGAAPAPKRPRALPAPRVEPWSGIGGRAAAYLLELVRVSGRDGLTRAQAVLACKGWGDGTIGDGFKRLLTDGYLERVERGVYRLTEAGRAAPPVPPGTLPLTEPVREEAAAG
jgi:hypothetical protein